MKKSLLFILASLIAIFALTGCADEPAKEEGNKPLPDKVTPINLKDPKTLVGTYEITFFYTDGAQLLPLSSDCSNASKYVDASLIPQQTQCDTTKMKGYGTVEFDGKNLQIKTKIQMTSSGMTTGIFSGMLKPQQYNYTVFTDIPLSAISSNSINTGSNVVKGTSGRNLEALVKPKNTDCSQANDSGCSTYTFTVEDDGKTIVNKMVDKSNMAAANVVVRMRKVKDIVDNALMDPNKLLAEPIIEGFVENPQQ